MAKIQLDLACEISDQPRSRLKTKLAVLLCVAVIVAPLAWEGGQILIANWCEVFDKSYVAKTPILDYLSATYEGSREDLHEFLVPYLGSMSWRSELVFPILLLMMAVGARILWRAPS